MTEAETAREPLLCRDRAFYRRAWSLAFPLVIQQLLMVGVNALNTLMMGRFGETEMAAVSQASQLYYIFTIIAYGLVSPVGVLVAQYWGKRDGETTKTLLGICFRIAVIFGAGCTLIVALFPSAVMRIMTSDAAVLAIGRKYLLITAATMIPFCISDEIYSYVRAVGRVRLVFWGNLVCYSVNILLNYLFIFGRAGMPALGALGPAVGTLVSRVIEFLFLLLCLFSKSSEPALHLRDLARFDGALFRDYVAVAKPILGHELIWSFGTSASQIVMGQISTGAVAAYNIVYTLNQMMSGVLTGYSGASQILVGNAIGAGDIEGTKRQARSLMLVATGLGLGGMLLVLLLGNPFIGLFSITEETRAYARQLLPIMAAVTFFNAWEIIGLVGILRAGGDAKTGFWTDIVTMWMIAIPLGLLAAFRWKLSPVLVILLIKADMPMKSIVGLVRVLRMHWINDLTRSGAHARTEEISRGEV
ncbi:MAG: MATE family efflux transporter [Oscillospiraceae bacterium]|nr:MATE family efflux transporter [Oscillospiraceae bacterium]